MGAASEVECSGLEEHDPTPHGDGVDGLPNTDVVGGAVRQGVGRCEPTSRAVLLEALAESRDSKSLISAAWWVCGLFSWRSSPMRSWCLTVATGVLPQHSAGAGEAYTFR